MFQDRLDAGRQLAMRLIRFKEKQPVVLGIPRGGIEVAFEVALVLDAPLFPLVVRKIGHHENPEMAVGAIGPDEKVRYSFDTFDAVMKNPGMYAKVVGTERMELKRRQTAFGSKLLPNLSKKTIIVVDDGIATGATLKAALDWIKIQKPAHIVIAVPCAHPDIAESIRTMGYPLICLEEDPDFQAVGQFYRNFTPTSDEQACVFLMRAKSRMEKKTNK